jgi:hypothetical protein
MKKFLVFFLILGIGGTLAAQENQWSVTGAVRANGQLDIKDNEPDARIKSSGDDVYDFADTGVEASITRISKEGWWTRIWGKVSQSDFGKKDGSAGISNSKMIDGGWWVGANLTFDTETTGLGNAYVNLLIVNWDQENNQFGIKVNTQFTVGNSNAMVNLFDRYDTADGSALFLSWYGGRLLAETGVGIWTTEVWAPTIWDADDYDGYEEIDVVQSNGYKYDHFGPAFRLQIRRVVPGLNFGVAWPDLIRPFLENPKYNHTEEDVRNFTVGARYDRNALTLVTSANFDIGEKDPYNEGDSDKREHNEKVLFSGSFKIGNNLTVKAGMEALRLGRFNEVGYINIGEGFSYDNARKTLGFGIMVYEYNVAHRTDHNPFEGLKDEGFYYDAQDMHIAVDTLYGYFNILQNLRVQLDVNFTKGIGKFYGAEDIDLAAYPKVVTTTPINYSWWVKPGLFFALDGQKATGEFDTYNGMYIGWKFGKVVHSPFRYANSDIPVPHNELVQKASKVETINLVSVGFRASF